jgi:hypothetical protein
MFFVYKLKPPRPTFMADMTDVEAATMGEHVAYWQDIVNSGTAIVFGPVADPAGAWGLAVVHADTEEGVRTLGLRDPAVTSGMATFDVYLMPDAIAHPDVTPWLRPAKDGSGRGSAPNGAPGG